MLRHLRFAFAAAVLIAAACTKIEQKLGDAGVKLPDVRDSGVQLPDVKEVLPTLPLPKSVSGAYELIKVAGSSLELDPSANDPIAALGRCADLVTYCYEAGNTTLDACVAGARACTSSEPWREADDCCPTACLVTYEQERTIGLEPLPAFEQVFFQDPWCFPGVKKALEGTP